MPSNVITRFVTELNVAESSMLKVGLRVVSASVGVRPSAVSGDVRACFRRQMSSPDSIAADPEAGARPVETAIRHKLQRQLTAHHVEVVNESHMHNVPEDAETHFKVLIVSEQFDGLPLLRRHRLVNDILSYELRHGVHALSIITKTPDQWTDNQPIEPSPACRGGFGK